VNVAEFIAKWKRVELTERSASQQHFLDLCALLDHPTPAGVDPRGDFFTFEKGASKRGGGDGWADVWKKGYFAWEYKGRHKNLDAAYVQLDRYRAALDNPPLLVTCDMDRLIVYTNFTDTRQEVHEIHLNDLNAPRPLEILRAVFFAPHKLKPGVTSEAITTEAARTVGELAIALRERGLDSFEVAHFLDRVVFSLFAEDIGLLPEMVFTRLLERSRSRPELFLGFARQLFTAMNEGGFFGVDEIRRFNGNLFETGPVLELTAEELEQLFQAARLDWSAVDPSIFGTLFERGMDPAKRSQLGAHYTSREDIETLVEPVVMKPLRREWSEVQELVANVLATGKKRPKDEARHKAAPLSSSKLRKARREAESMVGHFHQRLAQIHVLDPACGSGNFLYVTLQKLKDLEKEVIVFALENQLHGRIPLVGPWQLHGIEINPYAFELAQMTVWIGYLQWLHQNPFGVREDPVLRRMDTFECKDAILDLSDPENPKEPKWPKVDFIVGNPPFLGGKRLRSQLGNEYVEALFGVWQGRVPAEADLVSYWFEKSRGQIQGGQVLRSGLLSTQAIRGGANREVLKRIKETGDIFFAVSDREWVLDGAMVHVSLVGFDDGTETGRELDGERATQIHANLTSSVDLTLALRLSSNRNLSFMGDSKGGPFELDEAPALELMQVPNPHGRPNSDVIVPWLGGVDLNGRNRGLFIVDFGTDTPEDHAAKYEAPFQYLRTHVWPKRKDNRRAAYRERWWIHVEPRIKMREKLERVGRFAATTRHAPHRFFRYLSAPTLPDSALIVFAVESANFFGVLESHLHELWARSQGTQVRDRESGFRYTPTTCFETFPFPNPTDEETRAISSAARELDGLRERWLNPSEWVREDVLEFAGSVDGPWRRFVHDADEHGIGTVRYPRMVPRDEEAAGRLALRTLTNLYNQRPAWLDNAHRRLDEAVFAAYGWPLDLSDEEILERLLALNLSRADSE